ncbi:MULTISPECIES: Ig-like domain-containing protein [unclassified Adlercreutzia]|uniref:Ig-like domain-containing protein n=1 Tax=unclassified Adlercreutzia TaxID=2636013 RepID=UPI0013EE26C9|nr:MULTISPECIES: Ig-like domain-containing protein [unclassified Adlercreutzia]
MTYDIADYEAGQTLFVSVSSTNGNKEVTAPALELDTQTPDVSVKMDQPLVGTDNNTSYYASVNGSNELTAIITVTDLNFDAEKTTITPSGNGIVKATNGVTWTRDTEDPSKWTAEVAYTENAIDEAGALKVTAVDKAGNENRYNYGGKKPASTTAPYGGAQATTDADNNQVDDRSFVFDPTAPNVSVQVDQAKQNTYQTTDYYGNKLVATITVTDRNFNAAVTTITPSNNGTVQNVAAPWTQDAEDPSKWTAEVDYTENAIDEAGALKVTAVDKAGNENHYNYGGKKPASTTAPYGGAQATTDADNNQVDGKDFILDLTAPTLENVKVSIKYANAYQNGDTGVQDGKNYSEPYAFYDANAIVEMILKDNNGLMKAEVKEPFTFGGEKSLSDKGRECKTSVSLIEGTEFNRDIIVTLTDYANNTRTWSIEPEGEVKEVKRNSPESVGNALVDVIDKLAHPITLVLDKTSPELRWNPSVTPGSYYNTTQTIGLDIKELNFKYLKDHDGGQPVIQVSQRSDEAGGATVQWDPVTVKEFTGSGSSYSTSMDFVNDGHYTLEAKLVDPAMHSAELKLEEFTIDKTAPTIDVEFDNNDALNGKYYKAARTATVTVTEHNWDEAKSAITSNGSVSGWTTSGDVHTATVSFTTDGDYNLSVAVTDKAGNETVKTVDGFTIDKTAPVINSITWDNNDVRNGKYYKAARTATITVTEHNWDEANSVITSNGSIGGWSTNGDVHTATVSFTTDGDYNLSVAVTDKAGNTAEQTEDEFTVDLTMPAIDVEFDNNDVLNGKYYKAARTATVTVTEHNWDEAKSAITSNGSVSGWTTSGDVHTATVSFTTDGDYNLSVAVTDKAGNTAEQTEDEFTVDLTMPAIDVEFDNNDVLNGKYYKAARTATVTVTEHNWDEASSVITSNGSIGGWSTSGDVHTATVSFTTDGDYNLSVAVTDKAGNTAEQTEEEFTVDLTMPNVSVEMDQPLVGVGDDKTDYYASGNKDDELLAIITVIDRNFDASTMVECSGNGKVLVDDGKTWTQDVKDPNKWTARVSYKENAVGEAGALKVAAIDMAGNGNDYAYGDKKDESKTAPYGGAQATTAKGVPVGGDSFVLDLTAPSVSVQINQAKQGAHDGIDYYGTCDENSEHMTATITVTDRNFDAEKTTITPSDKGTIQKDGGNVWTRTKSGETWTAKVTYTENDRGAASTLNVVAVDKVNTAVRAAGAGDDSAVVKAHENKYAYGYNNDKAMDKGAAQATTDVSGAQVDGTSFILDLTAPTLEDVKMSIKYANAYQNGDTGKQDGKNYSEPYAFYNSDAIAGMIFKDNNGLMKAEVKEPFSFGGEKLLSDKGRECETSVSLIEGTEFNRDIIIKLTDYATNSRIWNISPDGTVTEVKRGSSEDVHNALVDVIDKLAHPMTLVLDKKPPKLSWNTSVTPGSYYNTTQTIGMTVEELNFNYLKLFDGGQQVIQVSQYAGTAGRALTQWAPVTVNDFAGSGSSYSTSMDFVSDGHYTLAAKLVDPATNTTTLDFEEFTIDKTAPVINSITWDNNDVRNGKYYKAARTATITVTEHNWDEANSVITSNGSIGGWSTNGDVHTATVSFTTDGDYNLSVAIADKAGNTAEQTEEEFTVDLTAPTITFSEVEEGVAYNDTVAPVITFMDEKNFDSNGVAWTLTGNKNGVKTFDASRAGNGNGETVSYADFTREVESDDIYTLEATLVDLAGNEAENSIVFSVNRFGSNFIVVDQEKYAEHNGYMAEAPEVIIQEINVCGSESEEHGVSVTHGLKTENLERTSSASGQEGGYYIQAGEDSYGWASYYYHVPGANFTEDGNYHVVVSSTDRATNLNNSASYYEPEAHEVANAEVTFILDTADPIIDGENVASYKMYNADAYDVTFTVTDNIGINEVEVSLDGATQKVTPEASGLCKVSVPAKAFTDRNMEITAVDFAGRSADKVVVEKFHVTTNFFELYWMWLVGAAALVAAGLIWFFLFKRKKDQEEEAAPAQQ